MADGSRHSLFFVPEVTYGVTPPTPAFKPLRIKSTSLGLSKETIQSEELRGDRQIVDMRHGAYQTGGDAEIELSADSFDPLLEACLGGTWSAATTTGSASLSATSTTIVRTTGSFITDGFAVGMVVYASGFATPGNNGPVMVTGVAALTLTVAPLLNQTRGTDAAAAARTVATNGRLNAGILRRSFTMERNFGDIQSADKPYHRFTGVEVDTLELSIAANAMVTGTFGLVGQDFSTGATALSGATYANPTTTSPFDSFTGALYEGGSLIAVITEIQLQIQNGLEQRFVVGSKKTLRPSIGRSNVSGTITAFFENSLLLDKFVNETESSIDFNLIDLAGNGQRFLLPRVKYTGGQPDVGDEGPISLSMPFQALYSASAGTNIAIDRVTSVGP